MTQCKSWYKRDINRAQRRVQTVLPGAVRQRFAEKRVSGLGTDWVLCLQGRHGPRTREQQVQRQRSRTGMIHLCNINKLVWAEAWLNLGGGERRRGGLVERRLKGRLGQYWERAFLTTPTSLNLGLWRGRRQQKYSERQIQMRRGGNTARESLF